MIGALIEKANFYLWERNTLVYILMFSSLYFTIKTGFIQFKIFGRVKEILFGGDKDSKSGVSTFESFILSTASRVGAGNVAGVVAAISVGGAGSVFWMWLVALLGGATAFIESSLAVIYKTKKEDGTYIGGTPYILQQAFNARWLGIAFSVVSVICYLGVVQIMSNSITTSVFSVYTESKYFNLTLVSIILAVMVVYVIFFGRGEKDGIIVALNAIIPIMAILYLAIVAFVLVRNVTSIPAMFANILGQAFGIKEVVGGAFGTMVMYGVRRGLFSNEAGSGNATFAAAISSDNDPVRQGLVQALGVFIDTIVICSATAFIVLLSPADITKYSGMKLFQVAMESHIGGIGNIIVIVIMFCFCMSTILAVTYYGKNALYFISSNNYLNIAFKVLVVYMVFVGGIRQDNFVWSLADFGLALATIINIITILPLSSKATAYLKKELA